jgi:4-alpha-glucanotransferase
MKPSPTLDRRRAGVLLHPTSLPSGKLDADAYRFVDYLVATGISVWQMLPLGPTHADRSPYHCLSVRALNPDLIGLERLVDVGCISSEQAAGARSAWLPAAISWMQAPEQRVEHGAFEEFCQSRADWLEDYALYQVLRSQHHGQPWWEWPEALREREPAALAALRPLLAVQLEQIRLEQYLVHRDLVRLRTYAQERGVLLFGDMSIFVAHDSAEVWAHREYFKLDATGHPQVVAGVPPDYFSATGQRWGNPLYNWARLEQDGFSWWLQRFATDLARFDLIRIDHFRGFEGCWEIPASEPTAIHGRWEKTPGNALFDELSATFEKLPLVAEDLGIITPEVTTLRERYGFPGMLVLQFAFEGGTENPYLPHQHTQNAVVYTGTHDNDTTLSWYLGAPEPVREAMHAYFNVRDEMPWLLVRAAMQSVARLAVIPMQDLLSLGPGHRMNTPGQQAGNWTWRFSWDDLTAKDADRIRTLVEVYGRRQV